MDPSIGVTTGTADSEVETQQVRHQCRRGGRFGNRDLGYFGWYGEEHGGARREESDRSCWGFR